MGNIIAKRLSPAQAAVVSAAMLVACMLAPMRQADSCAAISLLVVLWWLLQRHFPSERKIAATEGTGVVVFQQQKQLLGEEHERLSFSSGNRESADTINATTQYSDIDDVLRRNHESNSLDESLEEMDSGGGTDGGTLLVDANSEEALHSLHGWSPQQYSHRFKRFRIADRTAKIPTPSKQSKGDNSSTEDRCDGREERKGKDEDGGATRCDDKYMKDMLERGRLVPPNKVVPFENDCFKGVMMVMIKTEPPEESFVHSTFASSGRLFEIQIQGKFKKPPRGTLFVGAELPRRLRLGMVPTATVKICMSLIKSRVPELHWSLGEREASARKPRSAPLSAPLPLELPHIVFPLYRAMDRIVCTEETEDGDEGELPRIGTELPEDDQAMRLRRSGKSPDVPFRVGPTYTFSYHNPWTDFTTWEVKGMPTGPLNMRDFIGDLPISMVVYDWCPLEVSNYTSPKSLSSTSPSTSSSHPHRGPEKNYFLNMSMSFDLDFWGSDAYLLRRGTAYSDASLLGDPSAAPLLSGKQSGGIDVNEEEKKYDAVMQSSLGGIESNESGASHTMVLPSPSSEDERDAATLAAPCSSVMDFMEPLQHGTKPLGLITPPPAPPQFRDLALENAQSDAPVPPTPEVRMESGTPSVSAAAPSRSPSRSPSTSVDGSDSDLSGEYDVSSFLSSHQFPDSPTTTPRNSVDERRAPRQYARQRALTDESVRASLSAFDRTRREKRSLDVATAPSTISGSPPPFSASGTAPLVSGVEIPIEALSPEGLDDAASSWRHENHQDAQAELSLDFEPRFRSVVVRARRRATCLRLVKVQSGDGGGHQGAPDCYAKGLATEEKCPEDRAVLRNGDLVVVELSSTGQFLTVSTIWAPLFGSSEVLSSLTASQPTSRKYRRSLGALVALPSLYAGRRRRRRRTKNASSSRQDKVDSKLDLSMRRQLITWNALATEELESEEQPPRRRSRSFDSVATRESARGRHGRGDAGPEDKHKESNQNGRRGGKYSAAASSTCFATSQEFRLVACGEASIPLGAPLCEHMEFKLVHSGVNEGEVMIALQASSSMGGHQLFLSAARLSDDDAPQVAVASASPEETSFERRCGTPLKLRLASCSAFRSSKAVQEQSSSDQVARQEMQRVTRWDQVRVDCPAWVSVLHRQHRSGEIAFVLRASWKEEVRGDDKESSNEQGTGNEQDGESHDDESSSKVVAPARGTSAETLMEHVDKEIGASPMEVVTHSVSTLRTGRELRSVIQAYQMLQALEGPGAAAGDASAVPSSLPTAHARGRSKRFSRLAQLMESFLDSDEDEGDVYDEAKTSYCDEDGFNVPMSDVDFDDNGVNMLSEGKHRAPAVARHPFEAAPLPSLSKSDQNVRMLASLLNDVTKPSRLASATTTTCDDNASSKMPKEATVEETALRKAKADAKAEWEAQLIRRRSEVRKQVLSLIFGEDVDSAPLEEQKGQQNQCRQFDDPHECRCSLSELDNYFLLGKAADLGVRRFRSDKPTEASNGGSPNDRVNVAEHDPEAPPKAQAMPPSLQPSNSPEFGALCFEVIAARCLHEGHWREECVCIYAASHLAFFPPQFRGPSRFKKQRVPPLPPPATRTAPSRRKQREALPKSSVTDYYHSASLSSSTMSTTNYVVLPLHEITSIRVLGEPSSSSTASLVCSAGVSSMARNMSPLSGYPCLVVETAGRCHYLCFASIASLVRTRTVIESEQKRTMVGSVALDAGDDNSPQAAAAASVRVSSDPRESYIHSSYRWCRGPVRYVLNARRFSFDLPAQPPGIAASSSTPSSSFSDHRLAGELLRTALRLTPEQSPEMTYFLDLASALRGLGKLPYLCDNPTSSQEMNDIPNATATDDQPVAAIQQCFWLNLYHALLQHALLLLGPPSSSQWATFHSQVCYELFGTVFSLVEIEHCCLRGNLSRPARIYDATIEPFGVSLEARRDDQETRASKASLLARKRVKKKRATVSFPPVPPVDDERYAFAVPAADKTMPMVESTGGGVDARLNFALHDSSAGCLGSGGGEQDSDHGPDKDSGNEATVEVVEPRTLQRFLNERTSAALDRAVRARAETAPNPAVVLLPRVFELYVSDFVAFVGYGPQEARQGKDYNFTSVSQIPAKSFDRRKECECMIKFCLRYVPRHTWRQLSLILGGIGSDIGSESKKQIEGRNAPRNSSASNSASALTSTLPEIQYLPVLFSTTERLNTAAF